MAQQTVMFFYLIMLRDARCYGRLAVVSDVDDGGVVLNVDDGRMQELDYVKVRTMEQCLWMIIARTHKGRMIDDREGWMI
jgi:hypothetical protein